MDAARLERCAVALLRGALSGALRAGTLTKKQLREALATELGVEATAIKADKKARAALDKVFEQAPELLAAARAADAADSDDDVDGEDDAPPAKAAPAKAADEGPSEALLRGKLAFKEGRMVWSGQWSFGREAWDRGERSTFRLNAKRPVASAADIPAGEWLKFSGHFLFAAGAKSLKEKESGRLRWRRAKDGLFDVDGQGKNRFGKWTLAKGLYDQASSKISARRVYDDAKQKGSTLAVLVSGDLDDDDDEDDDFDGFKDDAGDDDDDAAEDAADAADKKSSKLMAFAATDIVLDGALARGADGAWEWAGAWSPDGAARDAGIALPFRLAEVLARSADAGAADGPPPKLELSGEFSFDVGDGATRAVAEPRVTLRLKPRKGGTLFKVQGAGHNEFGDFTVRGELRGDSGAYSLRCAKRYTARAESSEDDGDVENMDADEIAAEVADLAAESAEMQILGRVGGTRRHDAKRQRTDDARRRLADETKSARRTETPSARKTEARQPTGSWTLATLGAEAASLQAAVAASDAGAILAHLDALAARRLTVALLTETKVGRDVGALRKHDDAGVKAQSATLVAAWKDLVKASA
ncbi:hypothetical protein M885DRAFT_622561 [Pelagophyceae sp. CCMP2097]|nr:hypothetical protein M885DRAFT_622561 [Pelagophyceae sp. CCMP2097]